MRAAIAVPPVRDFYFTPQRASFLGARTVGAALERLGNVVDYHLFPSSGKAKPVPIPRALRHLEPFLVPDERGPSAFFTGYRRFGPPFSLCASRVLGVATGAVRPDVVLISSIAYCYLEDTLELAREIRKRNSEVPLIAGGPGVSVASERIEKTGLFDALVVGEGDCAVPTVLAEALERTKNSNIVERRPLTQRRRTAVHVGVPPDSPPFVHALRKSRRRSYVTLQLTRGCPHACSFCSTHLTFGRRLRRVPLENVERGLRGIQTEGPVHVNIEDDNLLTDRDYAWEVFRLLGTRWPRATISAENGLDYRRLADGDVSRLVDFGFRSFNFTLASTDGSVRRHQNRHGGFDALAAAVRESAFRGVQSVTYFICALPGGSPDSVIHTIRELSILPTLLGISPFYPVPGLAGFENLAENDHLAPRLCAGSSMYPWSGALSTREMVTAFRLSRLVNLAKKDGRTNEEERLLQRCFADRRIYTLAPTLGPALFVPSGLDAEMVGRFFASVYLGSIESSRCVGSA